LQSGIVQTFGPPLIAPERVTVAGLLKRHGYRTAAIGKWHLGWDWPIPPGQVSRFASEHGKRLEPPNAETVALWRAVFSQPIRGGPTTRGFDTYFGTDVPNWPPYCFIENDRTVGSPSELLLDTLLAPTQASKQGPAVPGWRLEPILPALGDRACQFIRESARQPQPFFLYLSLTAPHTPLAVNEEWIGKSGLGPYADLVMETDALVGRVLAELERSGASADTLVVFTSDNGCSPLSKVPELQSKGHFPSGPLRGLKFDVWEGGHRVPFIVRWPGVVKPAEVSNQLVQQTDLMATVAEILGEGLPDSMGEDSFSLFPLLQGIETPVREHGIHQSHRGLFALRLGPWKMIFGTGSGGLSLGGDSGLPQLYHLSDDPGETQNLHDERPEVVKKMTELMGRLVAEGRSTPGRLQANDTEVNWRRFLTPSGPSVGRGP